MYYLYIAECSDETLYTGITTNLERRIKEHNFSQKGSKYIMARRPSKIVFSKKFEDRSSASKEEGRIKKLTREEKLTIINSLKL